MNKKAIRILIVGGQGTGKTTLALELARIMINKGVSVTVVDDGDTKPFRAAYDKSADYSPHTIATNPDLISAGEVMRCPASVIINLHKGTFHHINLPDELRQPIMDAAADQIKWVNEKFPMRNGRVIFKEEAGEISEEDMKKVLETSTYKKGGGTERTLTSNDEEVINVLKNLAQDLAKIAKRKQKRRQIYRHIRVTLAFISASFFIISAAQAGADGSNFIYTLSFAFAVGVLSNVFTND